VLYLDTVQFMPGWAERDRDDARSLVRDFMARNAAWVIDGNYTGFLQSERLEQADAILMLEFPRRVCLWRVVKRYLRHRNTTRDSMAEGCTEKLDAEFVRWVLFTGRTKAIRRHYRDIAAHYADKTRVFRSQRQVDEYVRALRDARQV
jgi:adenylate kinase family enzyme